MGSVDRVGGWVLWQGEWGVDSSVGGVVSPRWTVVIQIQARSVTYLDVASHSRGVISLR